MPSKLGPHFIGSPGLENWIAARPGVYKFDPMGLGASASVPAGPLVVGKLDQQDDDLGLTDWKALMNHGRPPRDAAKMRFYAQTDIYAGPNRPRVSRYTANPRIDVWEDDNEIVPDNANEAAWYSAYCIEMMKLYESIGKKRANFSFAVGTPDMSIWPHLLPAVRHARDNGHYIALHEYMGYEADYGVGWKQIDADGNPTDSVWHGRADKEYPWGWAALRYRYMRDTVLFPAGLGNTKFIITEAGCDNVASVTPNGKPVGSWRAMKLSPEQYTDRLLWYDARIREDAYVVGATVFTVGSVGVWKEWDISGTAVEAALLAHIAGSAPVPIPPQPGRNLLGNPSFEDGWDDISQSTQQPRRWRFAYNGGKSAVSGQEYGEPEGVHKSAQQLPVGEAAQYIRDGEWCYKVFAGGRPFWARLVQEWTEMPEGRYAFTWRGWLDFYRIKNKRRDYAVETNSARYMLKVNDTTVAGPLDIWPANATGPVQREVTTVFTHKGGPLKLAVHMMAEWGISNNFFLDDWSLRQADIVEPEPPLPSKWAIGIDVSKWQGEMDWAKAAARANFAFIRASYGIHRDELVDRNAPAALDAGLPYGLYHYLHFFEPLQNQVDMFAAVIEKHGLDLPPMLDLEDNNFNGLTVPQRADFALGFLEQLQERLDALGIDRLPGIYTNFSYWRTALGAPKWGGAFDLWIANWTIRDRPLVPEPWAGGHGWRFWQHSNQGDGRAYGAQSARIDLNRFNGTTTDLKAYLIPRGLPKPPEPSLAEQIWRLGVAAPGIANTPDFALQSAMLDDGFYPLSDEHRETIDGERYAYRRAGGPKGETLVYYAPANNWDAIRIVGPDDTQPESPPSRPSPPPPAAKRIDLLPYMTGELNAAGRGPLFEVRHNSGNQARHQTQQSELRPDWYYLVKGENAGEWEHFGADGAFIYRGRDTSPGKGQMYTLYDMPDVYGSKWAPRRMAIGETFLRNPLVRRQRKSDCSVFAERRQPSTIRLADIRTAVTVNNIFVGDCIVLEWLLSPDGRNQVEEAWMYSKLYGLVAWSKANGEYSEISEVHAPGARPDNKREPVVCP